MQGFPHEVPVKSDIFVRVDLTVENEFTFS